MIHYFVFFLQHQTMKTFAILAVAFLAVASARRMGPFPAKLL